MKHKSVDVAVILFWAAIFFVYGVGVWEQLK